MEPSGFTYLRAFQSDAQKQRWYAFWPVRRMRLPDAVAARLRRLAGHLQGADQACLVVVMGVANVGKTTLAGRLARVMAEERATPDEPVLYVEEFLTKKGSAIRRLALGIVEDRGSWASLLMDGGRCPTGDALMGSAPANALVLMVDVLGEEDGSARPLWTAETFKFEVARRQRAHLDTWTDERLRQVFEGAHRDALRRVILFINKTDLLPDADPAEAARFLFQPLIARLQSYADTLDLEVDVIAGSLARGWQEAELFRRLIECRTCQP